MPAGRRPPTSQSADVAGKGAKNALTPFLPRGSRKRLTGGPDLLSNTAGNSSSTAPAKVAPTNARHGGLEKEEFRAVKRLRNLGLATRLGQRAGKLLVNQSPKATWTQARLRR